MTKQARFSHKSLKEPHFKQMGEPQDTLCRLLYLDMGNPEERAEKMKEKRMNEGKTLLVPVPSVFISVSQKVVLL